MKKNLLLTIALFGVVMLTSAQEYPVSTGFISDCGAFLVDNGLSSSDYGPNENSTTTICHDGTDEPIINLYFASFNLGTGDQLSIYDGTNTAAPLIGSYQGTSLQALDVYSTNPAGCLTVVFTSNGDASVGNFGAEISCGLPCARPTAVITNNQPDQNPTKICIGEEITFNGSSSTFLNGAQLQSFTWDFNDGTPNNTSSWPEVAHSFSEPGAYLVQLSLTDDNDCSSANLPDMLIYVATEPDFTLSANDYQVCVGQNVSISGEATGVLWSSIPEANFGGALFIPDNQNQCFSSELVFGGFEPGSTIQNANDLDYFFINFEHSFMGDLVISFICPNGQSIIVHNQGGGGTFLGEPVDVDEVLDPGVGYDYYWAPDATNGTWIDNADGDYLPSGTYEAYGSWSNLIGCPLNGAWTVEVCDMWASDNGSIFDWSVQFAPDLYPELISFTPTISGDCESSYWNGPFITTTSPNCDDVIVTPTQAGNFTYTYIAIDDHGCTYTDDISIQAYPGPIPSAGEDAPYCNSSLVLDGEITNPVQGINYTYTWSPSQPLNNSHISDPTVTNLQQSTTFTLTVFPNNDPQCVVSDVVDVFVPETPPSSETDTITMCMGSFEALVPVVDDEDLYDYIWTYSPSEDGETTVFPENTSVINATVGGYYWVEIIEPVCHYSGFSPFFVEAIACDLKIPNVFTPNGDETNDMFVIDGLENFPNSTIVIFNRWGAKVYESDNYQNNWSPGDLSEGTYYFILGVRKLNGSYDYYEQNLTLLRD